MDEQLKKILESIKALELQIQELVAIPEKTPHTQSVIIHATETLLPHMRSFVYKVQNIEKTTAQIEAEKKGLVDLARYEAFGMFYEPKPRP
jgi:hypothetical protein